MAEVLHTKDRINGTGHHHGATGFAAEMEEHGYHGSAADVQFAFVLAPCNVMFRFLPFERKILSATLAGSAGEKWV